MPETSPKGYTCPCGALHPHPAYVFAHMNETLRHTCPACGRLNDLLGGDLIASKLAGLDGGSLG